MGIKAKYLLNRTNTLTVTVGYEEDGAVKEGALTVQHRVLTPELWAKLKKEKDAPAKNDAGEPAQPEQKDGLVVELLELLVGWDVEDEDGQALPITEETLGKIDYKVLKEIDRAIYGFVFPNVTT